MSSLKSLIEKTPSCTRQLYSVLDVRDRGEFVLEHIPTEWVTKMRLLLMEARALGE